MENDTLKVVLNELQRMCDKHDLDDKTRANLLAVAINSYIAAKQEEELLDDLDSGLESTE